MRISLELNLMLFNLLFKKILIAQGLHSYFKGREVIVTLTVVKE